MFYPVNPFQKLLSGRNKKKLYNPLSILSRFASIKHDCSYKIFIYITPGEVAESG